MITYKAGDVYTAAQMQSEFGHDECEFPCATIDVSGDSDTGGHTSAILCYGESLDQALERRGLILAAMRALSMVEVIDA